MINTACKEYNWKTDLATVAQIWSEGSIYKIKINGNIRNVFLQFVFNYENGNIPEFYE